MIGGKWTTFRAFAEETADVVLQSLGRVRVRSTEREAIGGGRGYPSSERERDAWLQRFCAGHGFDRALAAVWLERYGASADRIAAMAGASARTPLVALAGYARGEIEALARLEQITSLADLLFRRMPIAMAGRLTEAAVTETAEVVGAALGWSREQAAEEAASVLALARNKHGMAL